ncbi:MAG: hypothetical protein ACRCX2_37995 [Paraclostridium sp.]
MAKVWKDLNDLTFAEVPSNLIEFNKVMQEIPKHDTCKGARKIYSKKEYNIYKVDNSFIIHNTKKDFKAGHTHIKGFEMAKVLVDCSIKNKLPRTRNSYLLKSLIRISNSKDFIDRVNKLIK